MLSIAFAPMFEWEVLGTLAGIAVLLLGFGALRRARGVLWRGAAVAVLLAGLVNPVLVEEEREPRPDIAAVVVDESTSMSIGDRRETAERALAHIRKSIEAMRNIELRVIRAGAPSQAETGEGTGPVDGTRLFGKIGRALADVPRKRMAGIILITDGQVHDAPAPNTALPFSGPLHVVLTGKRDEHDRRLVVEHVPGYGIVDKQAIIRIRVEDESRPGGTVSLTLVQDGSAPRSISATVGQSIDIPMTLGHAGPNILQIEAAKGKQELTAINNRAVVAVNAVRERLRVLLVSGEPHPGERVWRNLLKADPSVDLVHFTVLRPPEKQDSTPVRELSLIAFPIRELFETKLNDFDLIIFDRYRRRGVLPAVYIDNIARYVERGGAVLEAAGPEFAESNSLYYTPLGAILPGAPSGKVFERALRPRLTATGQRHTVTADLAGAGIGEELPRWGRWFRQIDVTRRRGMALMGGIDGRPLLIVDRVDKGRVAQLMSDQIWLWARGYDGGGPHSELLRRLAHWLMREPELEENSLRAVMEGNRLAIVRRSVEPDNSIVEIVAPSGKITEVRLKEGIGGRAKAIVPVAETGIYRIRDNRHSALAAVGNLNPLEFADMRSSAAPLGSLVRDTGGGVAWMVDGMPELRRSRPGRRTAGKGWLGLLENRDFAITSVREVPLLPGLVFLILALGAMMMAWRRESN
jgi:hypothetical protein